MSTNTGTAPRSATALAVETNVNEGMITSSPGARSARIAASSSADVQEPVRSTRAAPVRCSSQRLQRSVKGPLPDRWRLAIACSM
jgi:hypothetical protein